MSEIILAVDGGATKTDLTVRTREGIILFNGKGVGSNYQTAGLENVKKELSGLLIEIKNAYPEMRFDLAVFALAGIDSRQDKSIVTAMVQNICRIHQLEITKLIVENDAESTLLGVTRNEPGALLIAGTGAIAYAHNEQGKVVRAGGWGHRAGDEGSGYWIGREVLRAVFRMEDGRGPSTMLKDEVLKKLEVGTVQNVAEWLFSPVYSVTEVAKLSTILDICVLKGDSEAIRISEQAVAELALLIKSVVGKSSLANRVCKVFINGGAITHSDIRLDALKKRVYDKFDSCEIIVSNKSPIEYIVERGWLELDKKK